MELIIRVEVSRGLLKRKAKKAKESGELLFSKVFFTGINSAREYSFHYSSTLTRQRVKR
jgi:hypothetical protein